MADRFAALADLLDVLASPARLQILSALRRPANVADLRIQAARSRTGERPGRVLSRQSVGHHIDALEKHGLVRRNEGDVVLDHARLFASVDEIRQLAKLRSAFETGDQTEVEPVATEPELPPGPRLMVAYGRDDKTAYPLSNDLGGASTIGRSISCDIVLDYDPYASGAHARIERRRAGFLLHDLDSRNGTFVDWQMIPPGGSAKVTAGSLIGVGRSLLVLQT